MPEHRARFILVCAATLLFLVTLSCGQQSDDGETTEAGAVADSSLVGAEPTEPEPDLEPDLSDQPEPSPETDAAGLYVLDAPGLAFEYLPGLLESPVEGEMTDERGTIESAPNTLGIEFHVVYTVADLEDPRSRENWLSNRLENQMPPDVRDVLRISGVHWREGSMLSSERMTGSVGLVAYVDYNIIEQDTGRVLGRGRAYGIFRNGYGTLVYSLSPFENSAETMAEVDSIVDHMHLTRKDD